MILIFNSFSQWKLHRGTVKNSSRKVSCGIRDFLKLIRRNNPQAIICWVWGTLEMPELETYMHKGVSMYIAESGDKNVDMLILPPPSLEREDEDKGSRNHPGPLTHKLAAAKIIDYYKGLL